MTSPARSRCGATVPRLAGGPSPCELMAVARRTVLGSGRLHCHREQHDARHGGGHAQGYAKLRVPHDQPADADEDKGEDDAGVVEGWPCCEAGRRMAEPRAQYGHNAWATTGIDETGRDCLRARPTTRRTELVLVSRNSD
jgi:hypothetical protein